MLYVKLFFRGVFRIRPPMPRYSSTVHVWFVLDDLGELGPSDCLALKSLTFKTVMLMAFLFAQRYQMLHLIEVQNISFSSSSITLFVPAHLKHSRPRCQNPVLHFNPFEADPSLCIVACTRAYLTKPPGCDQQGLHSFSSHSLNHSGQSLGTASEDGSGQ